MDFFRKATNWFKGAFNGNDDEEKKRREAEARARAAQQNQQNKLRVDRPQPTQKLIVDEPKKNPQITSVNQLFKPKQPVQAPVKAPPPLTNNNKAQELLQLQQKHMAAALEEEKSRTSRFDRQFTDRNWNKRAEATAISRATREFQEKYGWNNDEVVKAFQERARGKIDEATEGGSSQWVAPVLSAARVGTGVVQGASGLYDLASKGEGTNRFTKAANKKAEEQDKLAKDMGVEPAYKVGNIVGEVASYFIPSTIAAKAASKFPKGAKLTDDIVEKVAKLADNSGDANKIRKFLADRMRKNFTLAEALEESLITGRYMGQNTARGGDTSVSSVATDLVAGIGGGLLFPGGRKALKNLDDIDPVDEVVGGGASATAGAIEDRLTRSVDDIVDTTEKKGVRNATEDELKAIVDDVERPAIDRKPASDELKRRAEQAATDARTPNQEQTALQHKQDIDNVIKKADENFEQYVQSNPQLTPAQIEAERTKLKQVTEKLIEDLQKSRQAVIGVVDDQAEQAAETVAKQAEINAQVADEAAARTSPAPEDVVQATPAPNSPEVDANNPYKTGEDVLFNDAPKFEERKGLNWFQKLSPDRVIRENITRPIASKLDEGVAALQRSDSKLGRGLGRFFTGASREAGVDAATQTARMKLRGGVETGKIYRESIADLSKNMKKESTQKVWASLDPEQAARLGIDPGTLTPEELALQGKLKTLIDETTQENLRRGLITPEQAAEGSYIKRAYTVFDGNTDAAKFEQGFRAELLGQYKGRKQVSDEMVQEAITDPTYLVGKKSAESQAVWAMQDYGNYLNSSKIAIDTPNPGYTQLPDTAVFGEARGKWIPRNLAEDFTGFQYNNAMVSAMNDVITTYDRWGIRQAKKELLTIFNPAVRLGNQVTNRGIFSQLNGINPVQFNNAYYKAADEIANNGQLYREAAEQGLTGVDITQAEFFAKRINDTTGDKNIARKAADWAKKSYAGADDQAQVAAYMVHRQRGYSAEEAARLVQRGFQDYKSVGFFYDMAAKTPLIGNAFVRFVADSVRIAKNAGIDHPLRTAGTVALWSTFVNGMSVASGESELQGEDNATKAFNLATGKSKSDKQKQRESRFGAPKLPFTDISTAVQTPYGEINVARFMPWYQLSSINDEGAASVSKFLPFNQSPVKIEDGKLDINAAGFNDPLLGQLVQLGVDQDFRGKSIRDPGNEDGKFRRDPLSNEDQLKNVARFFAVNNLPLGKEADQTISAYGTTGLPGNQRAEDLTGNKDIYGKERNIWQAMARNAGFKVEQYGDPQLKRQASMNKYHEEKAQIDKELEGMSPDAQEAYKRLTGYDKLRETVQNEFDPSTDRFKKAPVYDFSEDKWKEYAAHPEIYRLMVEKKQRENQPDENGKRKPIQPEFDQRLSESFRKQLLQNKMVAPGDDAELDQRMYSSSEWDYYQTLKDQYKAEADKYFPESDSKDEYVDELVVHQDAKFPKKPEILKKWGAAYGAYTQGKAAEKPEFTDQIKAAKEAYNKQTFDWTNKERAARGLPAIVWDMWNNPTFGYDETPSGSGYGFGFGGGGGGGRTYDTNNMGNLTNLTAGVEGYKPINPADMPNLAQLFQRLQAGSGGSRKKPTIGAASRGQG
jgi:hypothetical protein